MAIFNTSKKKNTNKKSEKIASDSKPVDMNGDVSTQETSSVLLRPHITEKASMLAEKNVYVFEVRPRANKHEVISAIKSVYNVTPTRVHIVNLPAKKVFSRGKKGMRSGLKKAMVYLKHGDKIEFV